MDHWEDWQKAYRFGTIVIWPPEEIRATVNAQRERYDPVSQSYCEAHITVTQPLVRSPSEGEWDQIYRVLGSFDTFKIEYGPLNSFLPYPCIWYEVQPIESVLQLREALHECGYFNLELRNTESFIPHLTITEGQSGPEVDAFLLSKLNDESRGGSFHCKELALIVPDESFNFFVDRTIRLGSGGA